MQPVIAFDVETTGRNPEFDQIIEISICLYDGSDEPRVYTRLIRPDVPITPGAYNVHGISMEDLADRAKAFDLFRKSYRKNEAMEDNRALLKEKYGRGK